MCRTCQLWKAFHRLGFPEEAAGSFISGLSVLREDAVLVTTPHVLSTTSGPISCGILVTELIQQADPTTYHMPGAKPWAREVLGVRR